MQNQNKNNVTKSPPVRHGNIMCKAVYIHEANVLYRAIKKYPKYFFV